VENFQINGIIPLNIVGGIILDLLIDFGVPVITALLAYLGASKKHRTELEKTKITLEKEIESIEKIHELKIREKEKELELKHQSNENDAIFDFTKEMMGRALKNPSELHKLKELSESVKKLQD